MPAVSTRPVSGTRDHLPEAALRRREAILRLETVFLRHGFRPLETPALERLSTLLGKYGEEGDRLIYRILHRGDRLSRALAETPVEPGALSELGLRYDLTVPLARVVAEHGAALPAVFRRYQIQPVWRADRAQRGRFREFTQCDADLVGSRSLLADAEALLVLFAALEGLGFRDFTVLLNHRELLRGLLAASGIAADGETATLVVLDKLDKIGREAVAAELGRLEAVGPEKARRLLDLLPEETAVGDGGDRLAALGPALGDGAGESARQAVAHLRQLLEVVGEARGRGSAGSASAAGAGTLRFSPHLARGLSYYTGPIFEAVAAGGAGSLAGGGRYDGLVGLFRGREAPAVGFSLGMERILLLLEESGADRALAESGPQAMLCPLPGLAPAEVLRTATALRGAGARLTVSVEPGKLGKQLARADREGVPFALLLGPDEAAAGQCTVRDLRSREQVTVPLAEVAPRLARSSASGDDSASH